MLQFVPLKIDLEGMLLLKYEKIASTDHMECENTKDYIHWLFGLNCLSKEIKHIYLF